MLSFCFRKVLQVGVLIWSVATACVPFLAGYMPGLALSRILVSKFIVFFPNAELFPYFSDLMSAHV